MSSWFTKMLGSSITLDNLENVLVMQLSDLASAEDQLIDALPKMADAASSPELRSAFLTHLEETKQQKQRLCQAFTSLGRESNGETCDAMKGLISEGEEVIGLDGDPDAKDAALIAAAQRVEHYEMAGYGTVRTFANELGYGNAKSLLQMTLDEEGNANKKLNSIAEGGLLSSGINEKAMAR